MDHNRWMSWAVDLAHRSPRSATAFAVGAVVVDASGAEIAHGWSRDDDPLVHAEESALLKARGHAGLAGATLYSTLEPCSKRAHRPDATCTGLIIAARIPRVVIAWREPDTFVTCEGVALLTAAGVDVIELPEFAARARAVNAHLPGLGGQPPGGQALGGQTPGGRMLGGQPPGGQPLGGRTSGGQTPGG